MKRFQSKYAVAFLHGNGVLEDMSVDLSKLSTARLREVLEIREQIEDLEARLQHILSHDYEDDSIALSSGKQSLKKRTRRAMTPEARAKIAAAQKTRWAKLKGESDIAHVVVE